MRPRLAPSYAASAQSAYFDVILVEIWHHQCLGADDHLLRIKPRVEAGKAHQVINCINAAVYAWISAWKHRFKIIDKRRPEDPSMAFQSRCSVMHKLCALHCGNFDRVGSVTSPATMRSQSRDSRKIKGSQYETDYDNRRRCPDFHCRPG